MTRGHIILLFIITLSSSFLFLHSSAQATSKVIELFGRAFKMDNVPDYVDILEKVVPDQSKKLTPDQQAALEKYQKAWNLTVTRKMDAAAKSFFNRSRCGVAVYSKELSLPIPWPEDKKELTYVFYNISKQHAPLNNKTVFSRAFARWEKVTGLSFNETSSFKEADIVIAFKNINETNVVADVGGSAKKRAMVFEVNTKWGPLEGDMADGEVDFEAAVMHQIGHMVGLGHTTLDHDAVMFPFMDSGKRKVDFGTNENSTIQHLFNITSNSATSTGDTASTGSSGGASAGSDNSVGLMSWVLSIGMALLSLCL